MHPNNVPCPVCGAERGRPCINAWGYPVSQFHDPRINAAR
jgi:hypothetical protein